MALTEAIRAYRWPSRKPPSRSGRWSLNARRPGRAPACRANRPAPVRVCPCEPQKEGGIMQRFILRSLLAAAVLSLGLAAAAPVGAAPPGSTFAVTDVVSDVPGLAQVTDPNLVNAWGLARSPTSPWWVSDNGTDRSTLYDQPPATHPRSCRSSSGSGAPTGRRSTVEAPATSWCRRHRPDARRRRIHLRHRKRSDPRVDAAVPLPARSTRLSCRLKARSRSRALRSRSPRAELRSSTRRTSTTARSTSSIGSSNHASIKKDFTDPIDPERASRRSASR